MLEQFLNALGDHAVRTFRRLRAEQGNHMKTGSRARPGVPGTWAGDVDLDSPINFASIADPIAEREARTCLMCLSRDKRVPGTLVARDAAGHEWFECPDHGATDNLAQTVRVSSMPIADWVRAELTK